MLHQGHRNQFQLLSVTGEWYGQENCCCIMSQNVSQELSFLNSKLWCLQLDAEQQAGSQPNPQPYRSTCLFSLLPFQPAAPPIPWQRKEAAEYRSGRKSRKSWSDCAHLTCGGFLPAQSTTDDREETKENGKMACLNFLPLVQPCEKSLWASCSSSSTYICCIMAIVYQPLPSPGLSSGFWSLTLLLLDKKGAAQFRQTCC